MKRRRIVQSAPGSKPALNLYTIWQELQTIAGDADRRRLAVLIDQFELEYPEIYAQIDTMADWEPDAVASTLMSRWPLLWGVFRAVPNVRNIIALIQEGIKNRRADGQENRDI